MNEEQEPELRWWSAYMSHDQERRESGHMVVEGACRPGEYLEYIGRRQRGLLQHPTCSFTTVPVFRAVKDAAEEAALRLGVGEGEFQLTWVALRPL